MGIPPDPLPGLERTLISVIVLLLAGILLVTLPDDEAIRLIAAGMVGAVLGNWLPMGGTVKNGKNGIGEGHG